MSQSAISNANIVVEQQPPIETRTARRKRLKASAASQTQSQGELLCRQIAQIREKIFRLACSSAWAEDCLYRGTDYAPDFRCRCGLCRAKFPNRRYPRAARESTISVDCQVEADEDPELAEDLARLRNERVRIGSVFVSMPQYDRGSSAGRKKRGHRRRSKRFQRILGNT
jgi:hypothetical protein